MKLPKKDIKKINNAKKRLEKDCDNLWSKIIKHKAGWKCEKCGRDGLGLNSHHIFSRRFKNTRWDLDNGICLCVACHFMAHQRSIEFAEWIIKSKKNQYEKIKFHSTIRHRKVDMKSLKLYLENVIKKYST